MEPCPFLRFLLPLSSIMPTLAPPPSTDHPLPAVLSLIGNTPLVEITRLDTGPCQLFVKLENQNPTGSIKDRVALAMIEAAERDGRLRPGGTVVEATAGNTGLGLAAGCRREGLPRAARHPRQDEPGENQPCSRPRCPGASHPLGRGPWPPGVYQDLAARLADGIPGGFYVNQFANPANPLAHETSTGPEIWDQTGHDVDAVVCGVGSGGTLTGLSRFFARVQPDLELVLADPDGSILTPYLQSGVLGQAGSWAVEGIGEDFIPDIADLSRVRAAYSITDEESFATARELLRQEGILGGSSSGTLLAGALRYCREQNRPKRVVTFVCDSGNKYLSKMYNDFWMAEQGFIRRAQQNDLRDLILHRHEAGEVIAVGPEDTLATAFKRMRAADVSQLPVVDASGYVVGILDESDILVKVHAGSEHFQALVRFAMTDRLETLSPAAGIDDLLGVFDRGRVAIVMDDNRFLGLITRSDLLSYLRLQLS